jgi:hypothetical protein
MKCLMRMHAKDNKGVLFYETILSFRQQRHTHIEAVPVPSEQFQDAPAYFRVSPVFPCFSVSCLSGLSHHGHVINPIEHTRPSPCR